VTTDPKTLRSAMLCAYGVMRFMRRVQAGVEDVEGALEQGQYGAAALMARTVSLLCLSLRSLAHGAPLDLDEESVAFDVFAAVPPDEIAAALELASDALDVDGTNAGAWLTRLHAFVADTERVLGHDGPIPLLRSPEGGLAMIRIARRWLPTLLQFGLPSPLPERWSVLGAPDEGGPMPS